MALRIEKLTRAHAVDGFDCGTPALNRFLERYALQSQLADASRTYVALDGIEVIGFYTLVVGEVAHANAPARIVKGLAKYPVPVMVLARLAVSLARQGQGVGAGLLKDALVRIVAAADHAGIRAVAVHARDDAARAFYERFDFQRSPTDSYHLLLLMKDDLARALIEARTAAGLSQAQLARRMRTSQSYIARIEGGSVRPSTDALERFAHATRTRLRIVFEPQPTG